MFKSIKQKSILLMLVSIMILVTACGSKEPVKKEDTQNRSEETRTIETDFGPVEVPANPERVIATIVQGDVLALGVVPVGTSFNTGGVFEEDLKDSTVIDAFSLNPEEIMSLNPDLIIWNGHDEEVYETLSKIAPTVMHDFFGMDYPERLQLLGNILNNDNGGEKLVAEFEEKVENARKLIKENGLEGKTALCLENREGVLSLAWKGRGAPLMYDTLGFTLPEKLAEDAKNPANDKPASVKVSYEVMDQYAGDVLVVNGDLGNFADSTVWKNLPAVKSGLVVNAPSNMFWFNDIISLNGQVDLIVDSLIK